MNSLTNQTLITIKTLPFAYKLVFPFPFTESPLFISSRNRRKFSSSEALQVFNDYTKSTRVNIRTTKTIHSQLLKTAALQSDIFVANSLLDCYRKSAAMVNAVRVFDTIPQPNVISWNLLISGYNQNSSFADSWRSFCKMHSSGCEPSEITYGIVLSACTYLQSPKLGMQIYSLAKKKGLFSNGFVRAGVIDLFSKNHSFEDALRVFHDVSCQNVVCWNAIISGAVMNGDHLMALDMFHLMQDRFVLPNSLTFSSILSACTALEELEVGRKVHGLAIKYGEQDVFVETALVDLYAKCGDMNEAVKKFMEMPIHNVVSWTAIISGFVHKRDIYLSFEYFKKMRKTGEEINSYTVTSILTVSAVMGLLKEAVQLHCWILKAGFLSDAVVGAALVNMYSKIGAVDFSADVFGEMKDKKSPGLWNAMLSSFAHNDDSERATEFFRRMLRENVEPDKFSTSSILSVTDSLKFGKQLHSLTLKNGLVSDISVGSSLSTMYSKCGSIEDSYGVFENMVEKDNVSWASMIAGFSEHGFSDEAIRIFREMLFEETKPDQTTLTAVLTACFNLRSLRTSREIHGFAFRAGFHEENSLCSALVTVYSKAGSLKIARRVFEMLPQKDHISCTSLISGYAQRKCVKEALLLFDDMRSANLATDASISSIFGAIALLNRPEIGIQLHAHTTKVGLEKDVSVGSSLVMMYSKCGNIEDCLRAFDQIEKPDLIGWTALIVSYAQHGKGTEALRVYELMKKEGIKPDPITFVGVLSACSHSGLVEEAYFHLDSMAKDYGLEPGHRHYACMVDLLGRSGRLKEAERFISNMPIDPDALVWGTLLAACKVHGDIDLGKLVARKVMELEPSDSGAYVSLSNMCADLGHWDDVSKIRSDMKETGVAKDLGWSYV